ncbi:hypothetical protein BT63DRAFT_460755 [Microthyrium microscopicum]|uniref:Uncharacterized protein n=1 Tax=Microthyrium microscopicum TaxID=703497 RepID=A0A6A6TV76_9PEZI|nr:hypothetical protein BT63DRAFT_460755 [Microthyrium microscopicum]
MNTIRSVYYGWATLIGAGGFAYWLAKRSINADRAQKALDDIEWRKGQAKLRESEAQFRQYAADKHIDVDPSGGGGPSREAAGDPAPTRHEPATEGQRTLEKSKYEATQVWRSPKGDRLGRT